jgi:hypothetical protein
MSDGNESYRLVGTKSENPRFITRMVPGFSSLILLVIITFSLNDI